MLSCGFWPNGKQFDAEESVLSFPYDNSVKRLTYFRVGPRLFGTHIFSWHCFSCPPSLSGFRVSAPIHHLIFDIVFATYLHVDSSKLTEGRKLRTSTHVSVWLWLNQTKTLQRILVFESLKRQIQPTEAMRSGKNSLKTITGMCPQNLIMSEWDAAVNNWLRPRFSAHHAGFIFVKVRESRLFSASMHFGYLRVSLMTCCITYLFWISTSQRPTVTHFRAFQPPTQHHESQQKAHSMHHYLISQTLQLPLGRQDKVNGVSG